MGSYNFQIWETTTNLNIFIMKQVPGFFLLIISLANLVKAQMPVASAHCNFDESGESAVSLIEMDDGQTVIMGFVHGLAPNPLHGFHIHEFGDLSDGCKSCGGHFNPYGNTHGGPDSDNRHVGDLGNIVANDNGDSVVFIADNQVKLTGEDEFSVAGRSIVIHEKEDDLGASGDPSGAAGARLKCCIIIMDALRNE